MIQPNTTYVVSFSGGKDSVATWLHLERGLNVLCLFADTGWESEETYRYLDLLKSQHKCPLVRCYPKVKHFWKCEIPRTFTQDFIDKLTAAFGAFSLTQSHDVMEWQIDMKKMCHIKGRPPSPTARFCTTILKLRPVAEYIRGLSDCGKRRVVIATGIRDEESEKRAEMPVMSIDELTGRPMWKPIKKLTASEVFAIHKRLGVPPNPLYKKGCSRVGCWPCIFARKDEIAVFAKDGKGVSRLKELESGLGQTFFSAGKVSAPYRSDVHVKTGKRINWADDVIRWALGEEPAVKRDGLFAGEHEEYDAGDDIQAEVCSSIYGLCE